MTSRSFFPSLPGPAVIQVLGGAAYGRRFDATLMSADSRRMHLFVPDSIPADSAVRIDVAGGMVLAQVELCRSGADGFEATVCIDQVIPSVSDLANLISAVMRRGTPAQDRATAGGAGVRHHAAR